MTQHTKVQGALPLNVVVRERTTIFKLFASEDETLLIRRNASLNLDHCLHVVNSLRLLYFQRDRLPSLSLDENLHAATLTEDKVKSGLFLNIVVRKGATILELFASENQTLLVRRDTLLILDLRLNVVNRIRRLDLKRNRLPGECLDKDLHASTEAKNKMEGRLLWDVVVQECPTIFELLASKDEPLLVQGDEICMPPL